MSLHIKVLGPGCPNCKRVESLAKAAVAELGADATFQKVTNIQEIMTYPIITTPGLVINEKVVCSGRVPTKAEVVSWVATALAESGVQTT